MFHCAKASTSCVKAKEEGASAVGVEAVGAGSVETAGCVARISVRRCDSECIAWGVIRGRAGPVSVPVSVDGTTQVWDDSASGGSLGRNAITWVSANVTPPRPVSPPSEAEGATDVAPGGLLERARGSASPIGGGSDGGGASKGSLSGSLIVGAKCGRTKGVGDSNPGCRGRTPGGRGEGRTRGGSCEIGTLEGAVSGHARERGGRSEAVVDNPFFPGMWEPRTAPKRYVSKLRIDLGCRALWSAQ